MQTGSIYLTYSTVIIEKDVFSSCHERETDSSKLCREAGHLKDYLKCTQLNNPDLAHKKKRIFSFIRLEQLGEILHLLWPLKPTLARSPSDGLLL